jgi:16S rRNA C1402 (ribose-2'-O) methylase RsmI
MNQNIVIVETIHDYYYERKNEFKRLNEQLKTCVCFPTRKKIKIRLEELKNILKNEYTISKQNLAVVLGIKYKELKKYPELVEIERKRQELLREVA